MKSGKESLFLSPYNNQMAIKMFFRILETACTQHRNKFDVKCKVLEGSAIKRYPSLNLFAFEGIEVIADVNADGKICLT